MAGHLYLIYYPITRDHTGIWGGPLCIMSGQVPAYPAFHSKNMAETFRQRVGAPESYQILRVEKLGPEYPDLVKGVNHLLVLPSLKVIEEYFSARRAQRAFAYEKYLTPRSGDIYVAGLKSKPAETPAP